MNTVLRPSRLCHQLPALKNWSPEATTRRSGPPPRSRSALEIDAARAGGVVVAGDQQEAVDIALLQFVQDDDGLFAGGKRRCGAAG